MAGTNVKAKSSKGTPTENLCLNTIRGLAMDCVQKANSGHPGAPMEMAPMAYVLWAKYLKYCPKNPLWPNRDRFVLSAGHASMLQYAMLHLTEYGVSIEDLKNFRQWESITPGHPEYRVTPGVEMSTGPLGQGFATGIGMAIAERWLAQHYNKPGFEIFNYKIYAFVSDGDLMEGISHESASLAGHLGLNNLVYLYSDNRISIDGPTDLAFSEDIATRFRAYDWNVLRAVGDNVGEISAAIEKASLLPAKPTIIIIKNHIGYGSPNKQDSSSAHGEPLGDEEIRLTKLALGLNPDEKFAVPQEAKDIFKPKIMENNQLESAWNKMLVEYKTAYPELANELECALKGELPTNWSNQIPNFSDVKSIASRDASHKVINAIAQNYPLFLGGSADLAPSNKTYINGEEDFLPHWHGGNYAGRNFHFGVREHAMGAIVNGMCLSGIVRPFGATFMVFVDYMRPVLRLASIMEINPIFVLTHDSIGVGEDGPTHQPIEHLASLRAIPGVITLRPADATETAEAWKFAITYKKGPICLVFSRQKLNTIDRAKYTKAEELRKGAYIISDSPDKKPDVILIASGSEVGLIMDASEKLNTEGIKTRVVSVPSFELFNKQTEEYKQSVLPKTIKSKLAVEMASSFGWHKYIGDNGAIIAIDHFGASAPADKIMQEFGFTIENVVETAKKLIAKNKD